jgi:sporulation protein YlmC with PRC-barrel domain
VPHSVETSEWRGRTVVDSDGHRIGRLEDIYLDALTGRPEWGLVSTGLFRSKRVFVPLDGAVADYDELRVPFDRSHVRDAPGIEPDGRLSRTDEASVYRHYGREYGRPSTVRLHRYLIGLR